MDFRAKGKGWSYVKVRTYIANAGAYVAQMAPRHDPRCEGGA
jgi:hypothetical protein